MHHLNVKLILASQFHFKCAQPRLGTSGLSLRSFKNGNYKTTGRDPNCSDGGNSD